MVLEELLEEVVVTGAAFIVKAAVQVTISVPVVTVTSHAPSGAFVAMVIFAITSVEEVTVMLLTVIPVQKDAFESSCVKLVFEPVIVTSRVAP